MLAAASVSPHLRDEERGCVRGERRGEEEGDWEENGGSIEGGRGGR